MGKIKRKNYKIRLNMKQTMLIVGLFFCLIIIKLAYVVLSNVIRRKKPYTPVEESFMM